MARLALVAFAVLALASHVSIGAAQEVAACAGLGVTEAQARLDADPTYATRSEIDPDGDGVACNEDTCADATGAQARLDSDPTYATRAELDPDGDGIVCKDPCADISAVEVQARLDADPTYATRGQLDADGDGVACNGSGAGEVVVVPNTGVAPNQAASSPLNLSATLLALSSLCAAMSLAIRLHGRASRRTGAFTAT